MRSIVGVAAAVLAALFVSVSPARASHQQDVGWITGGVSSEAEARAYPCPRTPAGGWERSGPVVCLDRLTDAWELTWDFQRGCTYDATGWRGDCLFDLDMGDHVRVWGTRGIVQVEFTLSWLHGEAVTPAPPTTPAPTSPPPAAGQDPTPRPTSTGPTPTPPPAPSPPPPPPPPPSGGSAPSPTAAPASPVPPAAGESVSADAPEAPSVPAVRSPDTASERSDAPSEVPLAAADARDGGRGGGIGAVILGVAVVLAGGVGVIAYRRRATSTD
jgi:hypothetical protein